MEKLWVFTYKYETLQHTLENIFGFNNGGGSMKVITSRVLITKEQKF